MRLSTAVQRGSLAVAGLLWAIPEAAFAQAATFKDAKNFSEFVTLFWAYASHIIFTLSVLTIITGGVVYVASAGAEERVDAAREIIKGAIVSIILVIISGSAIDLLIDKPQEGIECAETVVNGVVKKVCDAPGDAFKVLNNTSSMVIGLAGAFTVIMLMVNGLRYVTAAGDEEKIAKARRGLTYAVIGLVICITAFVVVKNVISIF